MALVIEAIHATVSSVMGASLPSSRRPKAPSYSTPLSVAAIATMPGIVFDSTACVKLASTFFSVAMRVSPSAPPVRRLRQLVEPHRSTGEDLALRLDRQLRPVGDHLGRAGGEAVRGRGVGRPEDLVGADEVGEPAQAALDGVERGP